MKRLIILLCLISLVFGCGRKPEQTKLVFAFVPKLLDNPVFQVAWQGAQQAARDLDSGKTSTGGGNGFALEVERFAPVKSDAVEQAQIVESLIERKVDGIAISVNDADALRESIDKAMDAGIPVVTFDSDAPKSKRISFYGTNNYGSGRIMGENLVKYMGKQGNIALVMGTPGAPNLEERKNGLLEFLKDYPGIKIVATEYCYDDVNKGVSVMEAVMQGHKELNGWVLIGGWPTWTPPPGAFASQKPGSLIVISFDTLPEQLDYVRQGYIHVLIGQKLWAWGYESVKMLKAIKEGQKLRSVIDSGVDIVTKENVEEYAMKWKTGKF